MGLGLRARARRLSSLLDESHRYTDLALRYRVHVRINDKLVPTDRVSRIYGGRWDAWLGCYVAADDLDVVEFPCSALQFTLATCEASQIEGSGGRGSGKSEGGSLWIMGRVVDLPGEAGQCVAPTHDIARVDWFKILALTPQHWLRRIDRSHRMLYYVNGHELRFRSADNPDSLRSWGGSYSWNDEDQDITTEAEDIIWPSLRCSPRPQLCKTLTPKAGEPLDRHKALIAEMDVARAEGRVPDAELIVFDSYSNPFISHRVFELAKQRMDDRRYRQEIGADWDAVATEDLPLILHSFSRAKHRIAWPPTRGLDITTEVIRKRCGYKQRSFDHIIGVDYNWDWPNYAVIFKVLADADIAFGERIDDVARARIVREALEDHRKQHWCVVDIVHSKGHAGHLGQSIRDRGYVPRACVVIDDASGQYNRGRNSKNSSSRLMRDEGFVVVHPSRNPGIKDAVNAVLAKLSPVEGEPSLHVVLPEAEELADAAERAVWRGDVFDKTEGVDHVIDALKYPIAYFCPAARIIAGPNSLSIR